MITVSDTDQGQRLDVFLHTSLPEYSRAFLQKLIGEQRVQVNQRPGKASYRVRPGDQIQVEIPPPRPSVLLPESLPLDVLYEDDDLIVINKSAGMVVHPAAGNDEHTLVNALLHHCRGNLAGIGGVQRPGIVHRLDKGTSGCLVVAKTDDAHQALSAQFKGRTVKKIYRAICTGRFERVAGKIETLIGRSQQDRKKMSTAVTRGRVALTDYRVLKQWTDSALVELTLHTGRTHQIRVHMAHIGHPIVGDNVYGHMRNRPHGSKLLEDAESVVSPTNSIARPLLHAYILGFTHPRTGEFREFVAPMPAEMENPVTDLK